MNSLWDSVVSTTEKAAHTGALVSLATATTVIEERGIGFIIHVSGLQERKHRSAESARHDRPPNPFLPPDPDLVVCDLPPDHLCVLNKFNVLSHHLLIVTRSFEPQESWLNLSDFSALLECMHEIDGLGFYNGGTTAGASQTHKHLQLVPMPLGDGPHPTPIDAVIDLSTSTGALTTILTLPFTHAMVRLDGRRLDRSRAPELHRLYQRARVAVGVHDETQPYNLLLTRRWMLLVPRARECWRQVSINALGFAGSLLVPNRSELDRLSKIGPLAALSSVVAEKPIHDLDR